MLGSNQKIRAYVDGESWFSSLAYHSSKKSTKIHSLYYTIHSYSNAPGFDLSVEYSAKSTSYVDRGVAPIAQYN